jgi:hypothetical protein
MASASMPVLLSFVCGGDDMFDRLCIVNRRWVAKARNAIAGQDVQETARLVGSGTTIGGARGPHGQHAFDQGRPTSTSTICPIDVST